MGMAMKSGWAHTGDNPYNILRVWVGNAVDIKHFEERISTEQFSLIYKENTLFKKNWVKFIIMVSYLPL